MVGWVGSVPNCWARGGGFETWIDGQPGCKKTARLQNARPTKYLTKQNCSRKPPSRPICKRNSDIDCLQHTSYLKSTAGVRDCGSNSCIPSYILLFSDCALECLTAGTPSSIPRSISILVTWNRLRENGTAVALVVYPLNIFFLATLGLLDCRRSTRFTHLDLSIRHNRKWLREEFYK